GQGDMLLKLLDKHRRYIRGLVTPHVAVKFMPEIRFRLDTSADYADKIDRLLRDPMGARDLSPKSEEKKHRPGIRTCAPSSCSLPYSPGRRCQSRPVSMRSSPRGARR